MSDTAKPNVLIGNENTEEIFVDGISQVHLVNGCIKIDLLNISPNGTNNPTTSVRRRLVMPLQQFLSGVTVQNNMIDTLLKAGFITKD